MELYQRGKVYAIICRKTGRRYIGSTCEPTIAKRMAKHVSDFKCWKEGMRRCMSYDIIKDGDYYIVLLELYPCNSRDELRMCEQKHIDSCECVNKVKAFQSEEEWKEYMKKYNYNRKEKMYEYSKEYREENKEELREKKKEYREENKEKIAKKKKEYYEKNKEEINKKSYEKNRQKRLEYAKAYREANKEKINKLQKEKRIKMRNII